MARPSISISGASNAGNGAKENGKDNKPLPSLVPPADTKGIDAWIDSIAAKLSKGEVKKVLDDAAEADQTRKRGPLATLWSLLNDLGVAKEWTASDQKWTGDCPLNMWPVPGTAEKGVDKKDVAFLDPTDNRVPEYHNISNMNGDGYVVVSRYRQIYEKMEPEIMEELRLIRAASSKDSTPDNNNKYFNYSQTERDVERRKLNDKLTGGTTRLRTAVAVWFKANELLAEFSDVITISLDLGTMRGEGGKKVMRDGKAVLEMKSATISVNDIERPKVGRAFEAPAFLRLNVDKAVKAKGDYMAIISSGAAKRSGRGRTPDTEAMAKFNVESFENNAALMAHFLETAEKKAKLEKKLKDNDDFRLTVGDMAFELAQMFFDTKNVRHTALGKQYLDTVRRKKEADEEETAA